MTVLAGGAGTRIRHLFPDVPKPLIPVAGRPFLDWVYRYWAGQGAGHILLSLGYQADVADEYIQRAGWRKPPVSVVREDRPLGTGGAVRFAAQSPLCSDPFITANGDSLTCASLAGLWGMLDDARVDGAILAVEMEDCARYGSLRIGADDFLRGFEEKRPGPGWINAGIYFLRKKLLENFPEREPLSLEYDVFPELLRRGARFRVLRSHGGFLDIGTPESLARAADFVGRHHLETA